MLNKSYRCLLAVLVLGLVLSPLADAQQKKKQATAQQKKKKRTKRKRRPNPAMAAIEDDPKLPRVLLLGDSISIGYTVPVRTLMKGQANVHRARTNCGPTTKGLKEIDKWLGDKKWDVIHFNWGLHDLKYLGPQGQNLADPKKSTSHQQVPPAAYEKNLRQLVARLKKTKAKLIWCHTTPVPQGAKGRVVGHSVKYNEIAAKVMRDNKIQINDLYGFCKPQLSKIQLKANVHFSKLGSQKLAQHVSSTIRKALEERK